VPAGTPGRPINPNRKAQEYPSSGSRGNVKGFKVRARVAPILTPRHEFCDTRSGASPRSRHDTESLHPP
jgi:hypothetical protein